MENKEAWEKAGLMIGGAIAGLIGLKVAKSKCAKKALVHTTAAALRAKEAALDSSAAVQEGAGDIVAEAKEVNRKIAEDEKTSEENPAK